MTYLVQIAFTMLLLIAYMWSLQAQPGVDSITYQAPPKGDAGHLYKISGKSMILPAILISSGVAGLKVDQLRSLNFSTREEINEHRPDHIRLDNYTQYMPAVMVYGFNAAGVKGKHNFKDRTLIYLSSQLIASAIVVPLKHTIKEQRPDGSNHLSFPSGHTATAFSAAQFMFREYKDEHFWLSLSGYPFAVFTGLYRTLNDKHWLGDVVAGAGIGILSTELAYWLYPAMNRAFHKTRLSWSLIFLPYYSSASAGLGLIKKF